MKKIISLLIVLLVITLFVAACVPAAPEPIRTKPTATPIYSATPVGANPSPDLLYRMRLKPRCWSAFGCKK